MKSNKIELIVLVNDKPVREFGHESRTYVEGRPTTNYKILIKNSYDHRVLVVPSVDGINPLTGKPATPSDKGYIVPAYSSFTIDGWRTSLSEVAAFIFDKKIKSYSSKTGPGTADCGVIGVVVFAEKVVEHHYKKRWSYDCDPYYPYDLPYKRDVPTWITTTYNTLGWEGLTVYNTNQNTYSNNGSSGDTSQRSLRLLNMNNASEVLYSANTIKTRSIKEEPYQLGTAWGETLTSKITEAEFNRGPQLESVELYYSDRKGLEALGIDLDKIPKVSKIHPQAFSGQFCQAPS